MITGKIINLRSLFTSKVDLLPDWVWWELCIYKITNLVNGKVYIGQTRSFYNRFRSGPMSHLSHYIDHCKIGKYDYKLYRAIKKYKSRNFTVEIIDEVNDSKDLDKLEIYWISKYDSQTLGYNMNSGGGNCEQMWNKCKQLNPELNGMNWDCIEAGYYRRLELYPDTNGAPTNFILSGHKSQIGMYPETNGASPEFIEAGHRKMSELYPETNGMPMHCIKAGFEARAEKYGMNGMTWDCIDAGRSALESMYPDTNGAPPEFIKAGNEASRAAKVRRAYQAILLMCSYLRRDGISKFTKSIYLDYKEDNSPQPSAYRMRKFFSNCKEFNLDVSGIIDLFPDNWIQ